MANQISTDASWHFWGNGEFSRSNTKVYKEDGKVKLSLFGNVIAERPENRIRPLIVRTCGWDTKTTKERLSALGVNVYHANKVLHLNDKPWSGKDADVDYYGLEGDAPS